MLNPRESHLTLVKVYPLRPPGTLDHDLLFCHILMSEFVIYTDTAHVGYPDTCQFTLGYTIFLSDNLVL
jgi:hypothetical protein